MKFKPRIVLPILLLVVLAAIAIISHHQNQNAKDKNAKNPITVAVATVIQKDVTLSTKTIGTVQPFSSVTVKSLVNGEVVAVGFNDGDMVKQGQLLVTIDPRPFQAQLAQAEGNLARDQASLVNAQHAFKRGETLVSRGSIAKQDFDQLRANMDALQGTIKADQAAIATAKLQLSYSKITAPISGRTGSLLIQAGNIVIAGDTNPLVVINEISPIYVVFSLPEQQLYIIRQQLNKGPVKINACLDKAGQNQVIGDLSFVDNTVDTTTGTIQMKATFTNENQLLWPGQFVTVKIPLGEIQQAILVPTLAVQSGANGPYAYVVTKNNEAKLRPIQVGPSLDNETVITKGLNVGEVVVTEGQLRLTDGAAVKISPAADQSAPANF